MDRESRLSKNAHNKKPRKGQKTWPSMQYREVIGSLSKPLPMWEYFFLRYVYGFLVYVNINWLHLHPNMISILSFISTLGSIYYFSHSNFLIGAILFEIAFILDCTDGPTARLTKQTSRLGVALEVWTDSTRLAGGIWALVYGIGITPNTIILGAIYSISLTSGIWLYTKSVESALKGGETINRWVSSGPYWKLPTWIELETVGFFLLPLIGKPYLGLWTLATLHPIMTIIMTIHGVVTGEK